MAQSQNYLKIQDCLLSKRLQRSTEYFYGHCCTTIDYYRSQYCRISRQFLKKTGQCMKNK
uniref:Uncharacterized protein n=1 Tax=Tetranychus urticae TaxID=32264 RepID=T1K4X9_TETUR